MKKTILTLLLLSPGVFSIAQEINRENLPEAGDAFQANLITETTFNAGTAGDNQVWDFSAITSDPFPSPYTYEAAPANSGYPGADFKSSLQEGLGEVYLKAEPANYYIVGVYSNYEGVNMTIPYSDYHKLFSFPMQYGDSFTDKAKGSFSATYFNYTVNVERTIASETKVDGRGTLKLLGKTYDNVLRVSVKYTVKDSTMLPIVGEKKSIAPTEEYFFFSPNYKNELLHLFKTTPQGKDPITFGVYFTDLPIVMGVQNAAFSKSNVKLFPNPASSTINLTIPDNAGNGLNMRIVNNLGMEVGKYEVSQGQNAIDVNGMPKGFYLYEVKNGSQMLDSGRIVID